MKSKLKEAVRQLEEQKLSCVILADEKKTVYSDAIGIKPLMIELRKDKKAFQNGVIADKVVGKAAALMAVFGGAEAVYGQVMSEDAVNILEKYEMIYEYKELVPYIENRTKTGRCPLEEAVVSIENPDEAFDVLEKTIERLMKS